MKPKIVVTTGLPKDVLARISREFDAFLSPPEGMTTRGMLQALNSFRAEGLLFNGLTPLDTNTLENFPSCLRVAASCTVGTEHVDLVACRARGIIVTNAPDVSGEAVADFAMLLMLAAARRLYEYDSVVRSGWGSHFGMADFLGHDLAGKTLGIVGMGQIGQALARRATAFGMKIIYHSRNRLSARDEAGAVWFRDLDQMLPLAQVLSLHTPLTPETEKMMDARRIALLPCGAIFVNTARGQLVDDNALLAALAAGHIQAAGLDVFSGEPRPDPRYGRCTNVILAPHMGSATHETRSSMGMLCLDNIAAVLAGQPPLTPL